MNEDAAQAEARAVVGKVIAALTPLLARETFPDEPPPASRWNDVVEIEDDVFHAGVIYPDGRIGILRAVWEAGGAVRYRTLIHEALHSFSPHFTPAQYQDLSGWEEGVVEQTQRLLRQDALGTMGVRVEEADFMPHDQAHKYVPYITILEGLRRALSQDTPGFYLALLRTPLAARFDHLRALGEQLPEPDQTAFRRALLVANAQLRRPLRGF